MSTVAVTGSAGFIGSAVAKELQFQGHEVVHVDREHGTNVLVAHELFRALNGCDAVIHLAGILGTEELFDNPHGAIEVNVVGSLNVLQACEQFHMGYVGITMPRVWENVYQATKQCARNLASAWHLHKGVRVSHVRAFNVFGPGQKVYGVQKIIPTFSVKAWNHWPIPIWGDGTQQVDLIHADDVARMLVEALAYGNDEVFDAGTGNGVTVNWVAEQVLQYTKSHSKIDYLPMRKGEHPTKVVAEGEGWDKLGWVPRFDLEDLQDTVDSYKDYRV